MNKNSPIGIFDSGIGGLTVASAIRHLMPEESLIYFGDTAHLPYGDKSADLIRYYAIRISKFLLDHDCKAIIIACNSASAVAHELLKEFFGNDIIVISAVDPLVGQIAQNDRYKEVAVIGTRATTDSGTYVQKLKQSKPALKVHSMATPLLAPMIEDGFHQKKVSSDIIWSYLSELPLKDLDALALACTHYPLIQDQIVELLNDHNIDIIDSAGPAAAELHRQLSEQELLCDHRNPQSQFYLSDSTASFHESAKMFFGKDIELRLASIWK